MNIVRPISSSGHKLGQIVGDWWEEFVLLPLLLDISHTIDVFLDHRFISRSCRSDKILWSDVDGNKTDYDFVLEFEGSGESIGMPIAFVESFWRRGSRHSKEKARDDTNKLLPMREAYATSRFLAIAACGEFTEPARDYVISREVKLFLISKEKIMQAFASVGIEIDYPDSWPEIQKRNLLSKCEIKLNNEVKKLAASNLRKIAGASAFDAFKNQIISALKASPQSVILTPISKMKPLIFNNLNDLECFVLNNKENVHLGDASLEFEYKVIFSDGTHYSQIDHDLKNILHTNSSLIKLNSHMNNIK